MSFLGKFKQKKGKDGTTKPLFAVAPFAQATLVNGSLKKVVAQPKYVDQNEWLAVNTFDFFNHTNHFYSTVSEFCTPRECPVMTGGPGVEYTWIDSSKKAVKVSATSYVDYVMTWIQDILNDESIFPIKSGIEFPKDFVSHIRAIFRHLFRVFAHIYHSHYERILCLSAEGHLNTLFAHFVCFAREFDLIDRKELAPLNDLVVELEATGRI
ncbi:MOB kinase activator 1B [Nowakowskiella sp. JEL0407]|nr:MOB kinase activator 1B [Nowakowskiella sp. JEL0407]